MRRRVREFAFACAGLTLCLLSVAACTRPFVPQGPVPRLGIDYRSDDETTSLQWLGVSAWIMARGPDVVVVDPFFSRPTLTRMILSLLRIWPDFPPNHARVADVLPALPPRTQFVLIGHGHYDHVMDVPYYVAHPSGRETTYVGSRTSRAIVRAFEQTSGRQERVDFQVPDANAESAIVRGRVAVRGFAADHAPHVFGKVFMHVDGDVDTLSAPPTRVGEYVDGTTQLYLVDFLDGASRVAFRVFVSGAANTPEGARALAAAREVVQRESTDVAILCVPGWNLVHGYPESVLSELRHRDADGRWQKGPRHVVLSHFDDFFAPYRHNEDPNNGMDFVIRADYPGMRRKVQELKTTGGYGYTLHEPRTGQCLTFAGREDPRACAR
jgi:hypothetical protein